MQREKLEEIQILYKRHWEAFRQEMEALVSTLTPEDERQIQEAITTALAEQSPRTVKGLGAVLAEQMEAIAPKLMVLAASQEKKDRLIEVLVKHLQAQILEISEILTADLHRSNPDPKRAQE